MILFIIWLIGFIGAYFLGRATFIKVNKEISKDCLYSTTDRYFNLVLSTTSFVAIVSYGIIYGIECMVNNKEECANW